MYSSAYVWAKILSHMEERLGAVTVSAWFDDAEVVELNEKSGGRHQSFIVENEDIVRARVINELKVK